MLRQALERPLSTLIAAGSLVAIGSFSLMRLPVALLPDVQRPRLLLEAEAPEHSRDAILQGLTQPLERRLASIQGVTALRSETRDGTLRLEVETEWQTDADRMLIDATRLIQNAGRFTPERQSLRLDEGEHSAIVEVALLGGESDSARSAFGRDVVLPELARLPGAGRIQIIGLKPLQAVIRPHAAALAARGITAQDVVDRLRSVGQPRPAGQMRDGADYRPLLVTETVDSLEQLKTIRVETPGGSSVLGDLARIGLEGVDDGTSFRLNGVDGVLLRVFRAPGANAVALARQVRGTVDQLDRRAGGTLSLKIASDQSREVVSALAQLALAVLAGILFGTLVLRLMLGTWLPTLALVVVIPASILSAFAAFYFWDVPLNVVSLAGLALAAGMLVDNSIVVLEAIETSRATREADGDARLAGTRHIARAVIASTLTTVVVFLPLIYLRGLARAFFGEQAFALVSALLASLLFSLTLTPVLASRRAPRRPGRNPGLGLFLRLHDACQSQRLLTVCLAVVLIGTSLTAIAMLPRRLLPGAGQRVVRVVYGLPAQLTPAEAERSGRLLQSALLDALRESPAESMLALRGRDFGSGSGALRSDRGRLDFTFADAEAARRGTERLALALRGQPDVVGRVAPRPGPLLEAMASFGAGLEIVVSAATEDRLIRLADRVAGALHEAFGVSAQPDEVRAPLPALSVRWDEQRLARLGFHREALETQLRASLGQRVAGKVSIPGVEPDILVESLTPGDPELVPVGRVEASAGTNARTLPLGALASIQPVLRPAALYREDGRPALRLVLGASEAGSDPLRFAAVLQGLPLAADESVRLGGEALELKRSLTQLQLALTLSLILVFLTLAAAYESLLMPLLIMTTIPAAGGGAFALLALTGQTLNLMSFLGLILLGGIVVNNAIVLVHRVEQLRGEGVPESDALRRGVTERYRPILMTTATTLIGMLPLALLGGEGVELRRALSLAVVGGLLTSPFVSLLFVPVLHSVLDPLRRRRARNVDA